MKVICPDCKIEIDKEHTNIQTDIAECQQCSRLIKISENYQEEFSDFDVSKPPKGCWSKTHRGKATIGASLFSPSAFFLVLFAILWNGFIIFFTLNADFSNNNDKFSPYFLIPFYLVGIFVFGRAIYQIFGKTEITIDGNGGTIFKGLGTIGLKKHFKWSEIKRVKKGFSSIQVNDRNVPIIILEGDKNLKLGFGLPKNKLEYLYKATAQIVNKINR